MNTKVIIAFARVEKDTPDFFKFRSIKKYFNANRISYFDVFNIVKLYDHSNNDYSSIEDIVFEDNITTASYLITDASLNKKIISALKLFIACGKSNFIKVMKSTSTDDKLFEALKYIKETSIDENTVPSEISINDESPVHDLALALLCKKVNADGKYKDIF